MFIRTDSKLVQRLDIKMDDEQLNVFSLFNITVNRLNYNIACMVHGAQRPALIEHQSMEPILSSMAKPLDLIKQSESYQSINLAPLISS